MEKLSSIGQLEWLRNKILAWDAQKKTQVQVCMTGCRAYGASEVMEALEEEVKKQGLSKEVEVRATGCHGFCAKAPVITIEPLGIQYQEVDPEAASEIVDMTLRNNRFIDRLAYKDPVTGA
ncbi:MAG: (2Fe-2S) ferredoxin domain-containing protein, partial [Deltaproteobacteria bacterium]|nr:(2Fe-2S) ferredoxin domain-containing protein [Deltaproteobacteria bacterium]